MKPFHLQPTLSRGALGASLAVVVLSGMDLRASAQSPAPTPAESPAVGTQSQTDGSAPAPLVIPGVSVEGTAPANTLRGGTGLSRMPGPIQSIPQTISVVPQEIIQQQNATTLEQTLRMVPGITSSVGEGGGGVQGDQFRIRGFNAQNDIYVDGLRDFGAYQRDTFTYEDVEVLLGPSGLLFGSGSVGGVVNANSRLPHLGNAYGGTFTTGLGPLMRGTIDLNQQISPTSAIRLNVLGQYYGGVVGRDGQNGTRWGIAPSLAMGLGTDVTFTVEYLHYQYDQSTDTGVPVLTQPGTTIGRPATEFGLSRKNWYGTRDDRDQNTLDRVTASLKYESADWLTLYNDTRFAYQQRDFAYTILACGGACLTNFFSGAATPIYTVSGASGPYSQTTWGIQNIASGQARFNTGPLRHEVNFGLDTWYESTERNGRSYSPARPGGNFLSPTDANNSYATIPSQAVNATRQTDTTAVGLFVVDRMWFTPQISVIGGLRWNNFNTDYQQFGPTSPVTTINANSSFVDPRAALIWEPTGNQTYYFSYSTSATPPGANFATLPGQATQNNSLFDPERNTIFELGGKWSVLEGKLGLTATLYRLEKANAKEADPLTGDIISSGDTQQNQGLELGATGRITNDWAITARYTYMDSKTTESLNPLNDGKRVQFVPKHAAAVWTTYELFREMPYNVTIGAGITYRSQSFLNPSNTSEVPSSFTFDAMVAHRINDKLTFQVNGYNLTDALNYTTLFGNRVVPSTGRTVTATLLASF